MTKRIQAQRAEAGKRMRRKVTGNLKLVHEMYGPKNPLVPHEAFKRDFAGAIASNEEIDKHFNKARTPCTSSWFGGGGGMSYRCNCEMRSILQRRMWV